jgi:hypothetical protein
MPWQAFGRNMRILKNNWVGLTMLWLLVGCATSNYHILNSNDRASELMVSPNRVLLECEWIQDADTPDSYGFMMHILDEENTVLTVVQGNVLDKISCERRLKKIGDILRKGRNIYIAGTGNLNSPRTKGRAYTFPSKGTFNSNERVLGFAAIANEFGLCYDAYSGDEKPCPREPFPLKKLL